MLPHGRSRRVRTPAYVEFEKPSGVAFPSQPKPQTLAIADHSFFRDAANRAAVAPAQHSAFFARGQEAAPELGLT